MMTPPTLHGPTNTVYGERMADMIKEASDHLTKAAGAIGSLTENIAMLIRDYPDLLAEDRELLAAVGSYLSMTGDAAKHIAAAQEIDAHAHAILTEHGRGHIDAAFDMAGVPRVPGGPGHKKKGRPRKDDLDPLQTQEVPRIDAQNP